MWLTELLTHFGPQFKKIETLADFTCTCCHDVEGREKPRALPGLGYLFEYSILIYRGEGESLRRLQDAFESKGQSIWNQRLWHRLDLKKLAGGHAISNTRCRKPPSPLLSPWGTHQHPFADLGCRLMEHLPVPSLCPATLSVYTVGNLSGMTWETLFFGGNGAPMMEMESCARLYYWSVAEHTF